jgi:hypothetical protein
MYFGGLDIHSGLRQKVPNLDKRSALPHLVEP